MVAQFSDGPWGEVTRLDPGSFTPDFGFARMYFHERAGVNLTWFRAYIPSLGRWLSRDPIGSNNPYSYVGGNPVSFADRLGLVNDSMPDFMGGMRIYSDEEYGQIRQWWTSYHPGETAVVGFYMSMAGLGSELAMAGTAGGRILTHTILIQPIMQGLCRHFCRRQSRLTCSTFASKPVIFTNRTHEVKPHL
jgi:RHS repeat-associated protein